jgi:hypothetical protein
MSNDESGDAGNESSARATRRTVLKLAGVSAAALAGCIGGDDGEDVQVAYGYGGVPMEVGESGAQASLSSGAGSQSAFARSLVGRTQAEHFDQGGEGVAYHDNDTRNRGGSFREDSGVDLQPTEDVGGGYNVGWVSDGEWLEYSVVAAPGTYDLGVRLAAPDGGAEVRVSLDGRTLATVTVPETGGWQAWETVTVPGVAVSASGRSVLRVEAVGTDAVGGHLYNLNWVEFLPAGEGGPQTPTETPTPTPTPTETPEPTPTDTPEPTETPTATPTPTPTPDPGQSPYGGTPHPVPGTIQAEAFDEGGEGVAYHDTTPYHLGAEFRQETDVDIQRTTDVGGGYNVAWVRDGEWLEYTTDVTAGTYDVHLRLSCPVEDTRLRLTLDGDPVGTVAVPTTGGWQNWRTVTLRGVDLAAGRRVLRLTVDGSRSNVNWVEFEAVEGTPDDPTETTTPEPTATPVPDDYGTQGYGEYGYGG